MKMDRNVNERIAEWGLHNGYTPGDLTVVQAVRKLNKTSNARARKYYNRFRYQISSEAQVYIEQEVLNK